MFMSQLKAEALLGTMARAAATRTAILICIFWGGNEENNLPGTVATKQEFTSRLSSDPSVWHAWPDHVTYILHADQLHHTGIRNFNVNSIASSLKRPKDAGSKIAILGSETRRAAHASNAYHRSTYCSMPGRKRPRL